MLHKFKVDLSKKFDFVDDRGLDSEGDLVIADNSDYYACVPDGSIVYNINTKTGEDISVIFSQPSPSSSWRMAEMLRDLANLIELDDTLGVSREE